MKKLFLVICLLSPVLLHARLQGQARLDSLLHENPISKKEDTSRILLLWDISFEYSTIQPEEGLKYGADALKLAERLDWDKGKIMACNALFANYFAKADYPAALEYGNKGLELAKRLGDKKHISTFLKNISQIYTGEGNYTRSLELQLAAIKIEEELRDSAELAISSLNIATLYVHMGDYARSLGYYQAALETFEKTGDNRGVEMCLGNLGAVYNQQSNFAKSLEYFNRALTIAEELGDKNSIMLCYSNIGDAYMQLGNYKKALEYAFNGLKLSEEFGDSSVIASVFRSIGEIYLSMAQDSSFRQAVADSRIPGGKNAKLLLATAYFEKSVAIYKKVNEFTILNETYLRLSDAYSLLGDDKAALQSYKAYSAARDSVFSADNRVKTANLGMQREEDLKQKQIQINKMQEAGKKKERTFYIVVLVVLGAVLILIFLNFAKQRKTTERLSMANKLLGEEKTKSDALIHRQGELLQQKDVLMKEIHHRVKNNLQVISTLLDLQLATVHDEGAKDAMTESTTRVRSISLIHQQLYQNEDLTTIEFAKFAKDLHFQVNTVFHQAGKKMALQNEIPEVLLDIDTAVPLGLILNELMTNSYKYAFTGEDSGTIKISIGKRDDLYELIYKDSGPGLPEGFNPDTSKSLGIRVIRSLSRQLGGKFAYNYEKRFFLVTFKDLEGRKMVD